MLERLLQVVVSYKKIYIVNLFNHNRSLVCVALLQFFALPFPAARFFLLHREGYREESTMKSDTVAMRRRKFWSVPNRKKMVCWKERFEMSVLYHFVVVRRRLKEVPQNSPF